MKLEITDEFGNLACHELVAGCRYRIGKSLPCEILIADPHVSRTHAQIRVDGTSAVIEDLSSTNGTWCAGARLVAPMKMHAGARYEIGNSVLVVRGANENHSNVNWPNVAPDHQLDDELQFKQELHARLVEYLDRHKRGVLHQMSAAEVRREAESAARTVVRDSKMKLPAGRDPDALLEEIVSEAVGLGAIELFMRDDTVTEVMVNGPEQIYVERAGKIEPTDVRFTNDAALMSCIERIVTPLGRRVDEGSPMVDARLPDGSRVNVIIPPLSLVGPVVTIRKFAQRRFTMAELVRGECLSEEMARFLEVCVEQRKNVVVSGGTGSGKTTLLNVLSNFIPEHERIVTIEDAAELQLFQRHVISLEARPANIEGRGAISIRELVKNSLRMRPDRIVVGECRGAEALDMLQAMNTGHEGSMTTGHANSPRDFLSRLEVMISMAGMDLPLRAIREQAASAIDVIVQQARFSDGKRRITKIVEVDGLEGDTILLQSIFEFKETGRDEHGGVIGEYAGFGYAPSFYEELQRAGTELDRAIFGDPDPDLRQPMPDWERNHG